MIPFPGESLAVTDVVNSSSVDLTSDLIYRGGYSADDAGHRMLPSGETWRAWVVGYGDYQDDDDPGAEFSWVLEVLSGTAMLRFSETIDPTWGDLPYAAGDAPLGDFSVEGPTTLVVPSTLTTQQGWSGDPFMLQVECLSGMVDVQQVKLRLWPPGGPLGGWSQQFPAWESQHSVDARGGVFTDVDKDDGGPVMNASGEAEAPFEDVYDLYRADLDAEVAALADGRLVVFNKTPNQMAPAATFYGSVAVVDVTPLVLQAGATAAMSAVLWRRWTDWQLEHANAIDPDAVSGISYIRSPHEVAGDIPAYAHTGGLSAEWSWAGGQSVTVSLSGSTSSLSPPNPAVGFAVELTGTSAEPADEGGGEVSLSLDVPVSGGSVFTPSGGGSTTATLPVSIEGSVNALLRVAPALNPPPDFSDFGGGTRSFTAAIEISHTTSASATSTSWQLTGLVKHPAFRVWDPNRSRSERWVRQWPRTVQGATPRRVGQVGLASTRTGSTPRRIGAGYQ